MQNDPSSDELSIALVAGEASGDLLGAALIDALKQRFPRVHFFGVGGERMRAAGFDTWWDRRELSVMGLFEVVRHLPRLLKLRRAIRQRLLDAQPDLMIGIDAPDFNLGLERSLRQAGMNTIHYVSPTVWAWRSGRAEKIGQSAALVLCLFPFEPPFYREYGVQARYTGHPLADSIPMHNDAIQARTALGLDPQRSYIALLPGSRRAEIDRLSGPMLRAAVRLSRSESSPGFVVPLADESSEIHFQEMLSQYPELDCTVVLNQTLQAMAAADVVVCASGTATLECMLVNRPMVVVYRLSTSTYYTAKLLKLVKSRFVSLPNLLADEALVPELIQDDANGSNIAEETQRWLDSPEQRDQLSKRFEVLHQQLRCNAAATAAQAVDEFLNRQGMPQ